MRITFLFAYFLFTIVSNAQQFGVQILVGKNIFSVNSMEKNFKLLDLTEAKLVREQISNPYSAEINLLYQNLNWSINLSVEAAYTNYDIIYSRNYPQLLDPYYIKTTKYNIDFGRAEVSLLYLRYFNLTPKINLFAGGGGGLFISAPIVSDKFIINTLLDKFRELNLSDDIKLKYSIGVLLDAGIKLNHLKPVDIVLSFKYLYTNKGEYDEPSSFPILQIGTQLSF